MPWLSAIVSTLNEVYEANCIDWMRFHPEGLRILIMVGSCSGL